MPHATNEPIEPNSLVIVTGANGFIASHTVYALLRAGYRVVGTVRAQSKADAISSTMAQLLPNLSQRFSTAIVPDITCTSAYEALFQTHSPSAILHLAAPFAYTVTNFEQDLMKPAVAGTTAVLTAALAQSSIKRIIHTNSFACIYDASLGPRPGYTYTAKDWCPLTYDDGVCAPAAPVAYRASKAVAEKTAWEFMERHTPHFDLVSLCPAMVFGPFLATKTSLPASIQDLNTSNQIVWDVLSAGGREGGPATQIPATKGPVWIDVRDVADAHVSALTSVEVRGRRLLLAKDVYCNQELADIAREVLPSNLVETRVPVGQPGFREAERHFAVDASWEEAVLTAANKTKSSKEGWRGLRECIAELGVQLFEIERGSLAGA